MTPAVSRLQGEAAPFLLRLSMACFISLSSSLNVLFRRIVNTHHARISPTAKLAAFLRAETDIPYCRQIADMCDAEEVSRTFDPGFIANHRAYIELRFKSLNALSIGSVSDKC